ncbi:hypothetical protein ARSEF1564_008693 [Beauveria bassiana]
MSDDRRRSGMPHTSDCLISMYTASVHTRRFIFSSYGVGSSLTGTSVCSPMLVASRAIKPVSCQQVSAWWHDVAYTLLRNNHETKHLDNVETRVEQEWGPFQAQFRAAEEPHR